MAKAMTHVDATATQAVERYLLGELSSEERDQFEAHAFDCLECAEDLKAAAIFLDTSRAVLRDEPPGLVMAGQADAATRQAGPQAGPQAAPQARPGGWRAWLNPAAAFPSYAFASAFLLVLGFSLYQNLVTLPALRNSSAPRALSAFSFVSSGTRGATPMVIVAPLRQPFLLFFDIPPGGRHASYHCAIVAEDGRPRLAVEVSATQARDTVQLFVPAAGLSAGPYTLVITGDGAQQEIARYPFVLQGRD
jgi:hypothetical protein